MVARHPRRPEVHALKYDTEVSLHIWRCVRSEQVDTCIPDIGDGRLAAVLTGDSLQHNMHQNL